ncbi:BRCA1-associated RING domain protein 1 [Porites harrisoni]
MIGWQNTRNALGKLEELLTCKICANLVSDPCSLEACDHIFCRNCIKKLVGADSKCPECGAFAWVKDMKTNRQLANTVNMCAKIRMLVGSDDDSDNNRNNAHATTAWEETQATDDQGSDSYQFSPREETAAKSINCDVALQENSICNERVFKKPAMKTYGKTKKGTLEKYTQNNSEEHVDTSAVGNKLEQSGQKVLTCKGGKPSKSKKGKSVLPKGNETVVSDTKVPERVEIKEKCFGRKLRKKRAKGTASSVAVSSCNDEEIENAKEIEKQLIESGDNLQFGVNNEDDNIEMEEYTDTECFTQVKSRDECKESSALEANTGPLDEVEGTPEDVRSILRTRAQRRKLQGQRVGTPPKAKPQKEQVHVTLSDIGDKQTSSREKTTKHSTETPVKQGRNKRKLPEQNFCSPQSSISCSPGTKRNKRGETPLQVATIKGCLETVKKLLGEGADPNTKDHAGWTPLHEACNHGYLAIAELLLDHGAMIDIPGGFDHDMPLHDAVTNGRLEIARLLLSRGAPLDVRNKRGLFPKDYAATEEMKSVLSTTTPTKDSGSSNRMTSASLGTKCLQDSPKVLLATGLSSGQKTKLQRCSQILNAKIVNEFSLSVTHIVTATNSKGVCPRTIKYLNGVVTGKWIVNYDWIEKCLRRKSWIDETAYEITGTNDAAVEAPKRARINSVKQLPALFDGCQFYFYGEFCPPHPAKEDLIQMVKFGGGKILSREPKPDVDETLCLPTSQKANVTAVTLAPVAYHANPTSRNYRCTQYVIYDSLVDKKPHIWSTDSVCTVPVTWLMDCASNFAILELDLD